MTAEEEPSDLALAVAVIKRLREDLRDASRLVWLMARATQRNEQVGLVVPADLLQSFDPKRATIETCSDPVSGGVVVRAILGQGAAEMKTLDFGPRGSGRTHEMVMSLSEGSIVLAAPGSSGWLRAFIAAGTLCESSLALRSKPMGH